MRKSWSRDQWAAHADAMLLSVRPHCTVGKAGFQLPGREGGYGHRVDALEAFARTFLLAGFRLRGENGSDPLGLADWYAEGIISGTDPSSPDRWVRLDEHPQAKVEAASLALVLDMTRPWIWDRLDPAVQARVIDYFAPAVGDDTYPRINWVWFRLVVQTFLRSVGGPFSLDEMSADLATHDTFVKADGWLSDGDTRAYDHYTGWALHLYPTLWARMTGSEDLAAPRLEHDRALLERYLCDAIRLVGADGSPLLQGRSLTYRFAAAAQFWIGAMAEVDSVPVGQLRRAASLMMEHFADGGAPNPDGLLDIGWFGPWAPLAQRYSGPGSPYWAVKGMLGLALPADHPVWTAPELALPSESRDEVFTIAAPGWIGSITADDGIVRVINHGTDHATPGDSTADSPLYARFAYSTATSPLLDHDSWVTPVDNSITLLDDHGNASHRSGMNVTALFVDDSDGARVAVAASGVAAHWVGVDAEQQDHGHGFTGCATPAGSFETVSLVRGRWEIRLAHVREVADAARTIRFGGWPLTDATSTRATALTAEVEQDRLISLVTALSPDAVTGIDTREDASPLGWRVNTPWVMFDAVPDHWVGALVELGGQPAIPGAPGIEVHSGTTTTVRATWPDGVTTTHTLPGATHRLGDHARTGPPLVRHLDKGDKA